MAIPTYKMSGDMGDLIYSLPIMKHFGRGIIYLNVSNLGRKQDHSPSGFTAKAVEILKPLLEVQEYVAEAKVWKKERIDYDIDSARGSRRPHGNLSEMYLLKFGVPSNHTVPWLTVEPKKVAEVVISRSLRYHNPAMPWDLFMDKYRDRIFVGLPEEYSSFKKTYKIDIEYHPTENLLELAKVIAGASLFIGNQSCPYAIAEGLKQNTIQESWPEGPDCMFNRINAEYVLSRRKRQGKVRTAGPSYSAMHNEERLKIQRLRQEAIARMIGR